MAAAMAPAGSRVVVCERLPAPGRKLLATGGGRCNFTTARPEASIPDAFGRYGRFLVPALRTLGPDQLRQWFAEAGVAAAVEPDGSVFPASQRAADVLAALLAAGRRRGARIVGQTPVSALLVEHGAVRGVTTANGPIHAPRVVLAAGGCSYAALGSDGSGFALADAAGHHVVPPLPALVPLVTTETWPHALAGIVLPQARLSLGTSGRGRLERQGIVLFTHRGLSGPAVLDLSGDVAAAIAAADSAQVTLRPIAERDEAAWLRQFADWRQAGGGRALHNLLAGEFPRAFAAALCRLAELPEGPLARTPRPALLRLARLCGDLPLTIPATEGWSRAMVTRGGVALDEIDPHTLQSRLVRGLYLAGEVVDLDGPCGGYNLTWAFASGALVAQTSAMG